MRIALYHNLPSGGALRSVREMVSRSARLHEYDVYRAVDPYDSSQTRETLPNVASVHDVQLQRPLHRVSGRLLPLDRGATLAALRKAETRIAQLIDANAYDLCFVHPCRLTQAPWLLSMLRTPTIYYAHEPRRVSYEKPLADTYRNTYQFPYNWLELALRMFLKRTDQRNVAAATWLLCNSLYCAESLYRVYGRSAEVVYPGVDRGVFKPSGGTRENYVVSVGTLEPIKGHARVVDALARIPPKERPPLHIAYERERAGYRRELRDYAKRQAVELILHHQLPDTELAGLYSRALVTVCAARLEPFGLTPLESISCGTPVVALNEGGFRETVSDGVNGLLAHPSAGAIAAGIRSILAGEISCDPEELSATVRDRTWDRTVQQLHAFFDRVVTRYRTGSS